MYHQHSFFQLTRARAFPFFFLFIIFCLTDTQCQELNKMIVGNWDMVRNGDGFSEATIHFGEDLNYQLDRTWPDGSKAGVKGGYDLNPESTPATLRLCLGDCASGSEWTTVFCIVRNGADEMLEIYMSDSGEFPVDFPADSDSKGMYIFKRTE